MSQDCGTMGLSLIQIISWFSDIGTAGANELKRCMESGIPRYDLVRGWSERILLPVKDCSDKNTEKRRILSHGRSGGHCL